MIRFLRVTDTKERSRKERRRFGSIPVSDWYPHTSLALGRDLILGRIRLAARGEGVRDLGAAKFFFSYFPVEVVRCVRAVIF